MTEVVGGTQGGPGGTVGSLQVLLGPAGTGEEEVSKLSLSDLLDLKREVRVVGGHGERDIHLLLAVILTRPGVLSSFVFKNKPSFLFSHNENITERIAVGVELILNLLGLRGVEYLPGVGLGGLESVAKVGQDGHQTL